MRVSQNVVNKKARLKAQILKTIAEMIDAYDFEIHPVLQAGLLREAEMLVANNQETDIPLTTMLMGKLNKTKLQVVQDTLARDSRDRSQLANVLGKLIDDLKVVGD